MPADPKLECVHRGNHSSTQVPDANSARLGGRSVFDVIQDEDWLEQGFVSIIRNRSATIVQVRCDSHDSAVIMACS